MKDKIKESDKFIGIDVGDGNYPLDDEREESPGLKLVPPTLADKAWMSSRRFIKSGLLAGAGVLATGGDLTTAGLAALGAGVLGSAEKFRKESRKAKGKPMWWELALKILKDIVGIIKYAIKRKKE